MATTMFFEKNLQDQAGRKTSMSLEFGRMNATGTSLIYITVDEKTVLIDKQSGREICEAMRDLAIYLQYDK